MPLTMKKTEGSVITALPVGRVEAEEVALCPSHLGILKAEGAQCRQRFMGPSSEPLGADGDQKFLYPNLLWFGSREPSASFWSG